MVGRKRAVPDRGDVVWVTLAPEAGQEQSGRRPAVVLSPAAYNGKVGLAVMVPVTSVAKGYPFEVALPPGLPVAGVILSDQVRTLNWRAQRATPIGRLPDDVMAQVLGRLEALLFG
jgi:mRNA interferase MazF